MITVFFQIGSRAAKMFHPKNTIREGKPAWFKVKVNNLFYFGAL